MLIHTHLYQTQIHAHTYICIYTFMLAHTLTHTQRYTHELHKGQIVKQTCWNAERDRDEERERESEPSRHHLTEACIWVQA